MKTPEKTPEELEQIREHNRKVLRELLFDSAKWLSTQHAIWVLRAPIPVFESALQAAVELRKQMRSGALPWATRSFRLRDGLPVSHMITVYPAPADLDAVTPENLITGMREISEGNNIVVRCWDFVDRQCFNRWFSALAEQVRQEREWVEREQAAQAKRKRVKQPTETLERKLVNAGLARLRKKHPEKYPEGFSPEMSPVELIRQMRPFWPEICAGESVRPEDHRLDRMWDTVARAIGRRDDPPRR